MQIFREYLSSVSQRKKNRFYLLMLFLILLFLGFLFYFVGMSGRIVSGVTVGGIPVGGMKREAVKQLLISRFQPMVQKKVIINYNHRSFGVVIGAIGIIPDFDSTVVKAYRIGRKGSVLSRIEQRMKARRSGINLRLSFNHNQNTLDAFYRLLEAGIAVEPIRSVVLVDLQGEVKYTPSKNGRAIMRDKFTYLLEEAVMAPRLGKIDIPVKVVKASLTEDDVERWKLNKVLGAYNTKFNPDAADRVQNLRVASSALNNVIIYPGQNFSFNTWVGPRLAKNGYKEAPVVLYGELVPGIGGGVCQVSSTLYNAVLLANLKIVKRYNHTVPSSYVPLGRDATVVYDGLDFIFENNLNTPVLLVTMVDSPYLRVAVLGEKSNWTEVEVKTDLLKTYPFQTKEINDPSLANGKRIKEQDGHDGYKVALYRIVKYKDGSVKKYHENTSIYPPRMEKYKVGMEANLENFILP